MTKPHDNPWAGRQVIAVPGGVDTWRFAGDGRTVELTSGGERAVLPLREGKRGWLAQSQQLNFLFRRDGMWMQFRIGRIHVETRRMEDAGGACP